MIGTIFATANVSAAGLMLRFGGRAERLAVVAVAIYLALTPLIDQLWLGPFRWGVFALDVGLFATFWALAAREDRWWLIDAAALQLIATATHLVALLHTGLAFWTQVTARLLIWALISALLYIAAWEGWAHRRHKTPSIP